MMVDTLLDMIIGMILGMIASPLMMKGIKILGMIASPLMMKGIKILKQRRRVDRILREISEQQQQSR